MYTGYIHYICSQTFRLWDKKYYSVVRKEQDMTATKEIGILDNLGGKAAIDFVLFFKIHDLPWSLGADQEWK